MFQRLSHLLAVGVFMVLSGSSLHSEEPLPAGAVARFGTSRFLNFGRVFSVAFSPDGKILAAGSWDGTVRLWDVAHRQMLRQLEKQQAPIRSVAFSPDGKLLACGADGAALLLWDVASGKEVRRLTGQRGPITFVAFSPDGKLVASKGYDQTLRLWNTVTGQEVRRLGPPKHSSEVNEPDCPILFLPGGKTLASATLKTSAGGSNLERTVRFWDLATGTDVRSFTGNRASFGSAAFSADGRLLAMGALWPAVRQGMYICLWDVESGKELRPIEQMQSEDPQVVSSLALSPDGRVLATSNGGAVIQLWEVATRREICRYQAPDAGLKALAFSPDGRLLACGSTDVTVLLWDVTGRMQDGTLRPAEASAQAFASLWADLGRDDVAKARRALWTLVAAGNRSVDALREHLRPAVNPASAEKLAQLVADLDSTELSVRTKALAELTRLAELAEPALLAAQQKQPSLELRQRIEQLLSRVVDQRSRPTGERLQRVRGLEVLEQIGSPEARQMLETLAHGASGALLTRAADAALDRLDRQARSR